MNNLEEESVDSFKSKDVSEMNRSEKRSRIRFYKKELDKHNNKKPFFDIDVFDDFSEEEAEQRQSKLKAWATRYGILLMKLEELKR